MEAVTSGKVRDNFGGFIDSVVREKPQAVRRNRDLIVAVSRDEMDMFLSPYELTMEHEIGEDGRYYGSFEEIDVVGEGNSLEELKLVLANDVIEYAKEYWENLDRYIHAPNRKAHYPFVFRIMLQDSPEGVLNFIRG
jgi:hypothetical protein